MKNFNYQDNFTYKNLKEIFDEQVIDLKDGLQTRMSSTGTDKAVAISSQEEVKSNLFQKNIDNQKIIFLNNEIIDQNLNDVDEANNDLQNLSENIIELKDEVSINKKQKIIDLIEEVDQIINLTDEVAETVVRANENLNNEIILDNEIVNEKVAKKPSYSNEQQLELLNAKINDIDLNSSELTEKLDEILNQKNLFSDKFNDELDVKLSEALNRSEENLESKLNNINDVYHQEFTKYEDEANKNFANLEDQIGQLNNQFDNIQNNINLNFI